MSAPAEWEMVLESPYTTRLKVEGGWLYRAGVQEGTTMAFVPDQQVPLALKQMAIDLRQLADRPL